MIGERIKKIRKDKNLNQKSFAKAIGISQGALSEIENSNINPSIETVISIVKQYNISLNWLILGEYNKESLSKEKDKLASEIIKMYKFNGDITKEQRVKILKDIDIFINLKNKILDI